MTALSSRNNLWKTENRLGLEVVLWDERLTTVSAHQAMIEGNVRREARDKVVDKVAAVFILQGYLDWLNLQMNDK